MRLLESTRRGLLPALFVLTSAPSAAAPIDQYGQDITPFLADPRACLQIRDAISCSAGMLNVINGLSPTLKNTEGGFVIASPQGALKTAIVLGTGGNASTDNGDTSPSAAKVEDGFKTNSGGDNFAATGKTSGIAGNLSPADPANNALPIAQDKVGTWDVDIGWLIDALTINGQRKNPIIGFDYNQPQSGTNSLEYWALISILDTDGSNAPVLLEFGNNFTAKTDPTNIDKKPIANEFGLVLGVTCYKPAAFITDVIALPRGPCPAGYDTVNNAQGDNTTEIVAMLPALNANLENWFASGYDTISVRMLFGCFDNNAATNSKDGKGYLGDNSKTTQCDGGGNVDIYLLASGGTPTDIPNPGGLALVALGLLCSGLVSRRRQV